MVELLFILDAGIDGARLDADMMSPENLALGCRASAALGILDELAARAIDAADG